MSRAARTVPPAWALGAVLLAALAAAASTLLGYLVSPAAVAGVLVGGAGFLMALRYRTGALLLLPLSLPLGRLTFAEVGPVPLSPVTALVALIGLAWAWRSFTGEERIRPSALQPPLALFLLAGVIGLYSAQDTVAAAKAFFIFAMGATVYLVASQSIRSSGEIRSFLWAVAVAAAAVGLYGAVTGLGGAGVEAYGATENYVRAEGLFTHPNQLGGFLALTIPPVAALAVSERTPWLRVAAYGLASAALLGLVLTYSRGAWVGTGAGLLALLPALRRGSWILPGAVLVGAFATSGAVLERLGSITDADSDPAVTSRFDIMWASLDLVADNPFLGVGLGNFQAAYGNLMVQNLPLLSYSLGVPPQAHNLFVNLAAEVGLVGLLAFVAMLAVTLFKVLRVYRTGSAQMRTLALGMAAGLLATLVHNLVDVTVYQGFVAILFFSYLGILDAADGMDVSDGPADA